ncbi:ABC transporter permease [Macrococcus hajekii]|uniref:ABC transporter permease n=1 Tax=Macrococcus hajekii TaxID=198482 RepID=A0A4R6BLC4_9STAP|nr:ABC transporter permease [Macrococcus hajekii]TDM02584.1 ABC transporter permease [Macrococcus hajekii]GGB02151.1 multidrug ABC transporter ATP-binding protein [Macrococcus hajekii]
MLNARSLYQRRATVNSREVARYSKFIFNGHFIIFLSIVFGALMLQYSQLLKALPEGINYPLIISMILALAAVAPLRTYFREADQVFLLPYERQLDSYIQRSIIESSVRRIIIFTALFVVLLPLYHAGDTFSVQRAVTVYVIGVAGIVAGLVFRFHAMKIELSNVSIFIVLFVILLSSFYTTLDAKGLWSGISTIVMLPGLLLLVRNIATKRVYPWQSLIEYEQELTQRQYKIINMFTDVKGLKDNVRRRSYLDILLNDKPYNHDGMFLFLFKRNFLRSKDAFWIIIRLVIIGGLIIWFVHQPIIAAVMGVFIVYIVVLQSSQFYKQQAYQLWPQVWPVAENKVIEGFQKFLWQLSVGVTLLVSLIFILIYPASFYYIFVFFAVMWWTNRQVMAKLKRKMTLLKD